MTASRNRFPAGLVLLFLFVLVALGAAFLLDFFNCSKRSPGFMNCSDHAANLNHESQKFLGAINRVQQGYFLETKTFAKSLDQLKAGIPSQTNKFTYEIEAGADRAIAYAIPRQPTFPITVYFSVFSWTEHYPSRSFVTAIIPNENPQASTDPGFSTILCENQTDGIVRPAKPTLLNGQLTCGQDTQSRL